MNMKAGSKSLCNFQTLNIEWCNDTKRSISVHMFWYFCFVLILRMQFQTKLDTPRLEKQSC